VTVVVCPSDRRAPSGPSGLTDPPAPNCSPGQDSLPAPIALGRQLQLNSLAVLLGLVFWGWLWGAIGMLLAIPILAATRVISEHIPDLEPVAEMLRE
jgi:hypothetical protein